MEFFFGVETGGMVKVKVGLWATYELAKKAREMRFWGIL